VAICDTTAQRADKKSPLQNTSPVSDISFFSFSQAFLLINIPCFFPVENLFITLLITHFRTVHKTHPEGFHSF
jgi:hypothetical protein